MKKAFITLASLVAASVATATTVTYNPLDETLQGSTGRFTLSENHSSLQLRQQWGTPYVYADLSTPITLSNTSEVTLSFTLDVGETDSAATIALIGTTKTIVVGYGTYRGNKLEYTIQDGTTTGFYSADSNMRFPEGKYGDLSTGLTMPLTDATLEYTISWNDTLSDYVLKFTDGNVTSSDIALGVGSEGETFSRVIFSAEGQAWNGITFSDVSLAVTTPDAPPAIPEPATATLSLLALAGLAARRRRK